MFSYEFWEKFQNSFSVEHPEIAAEKISWNSKNKSNKDFNRIIQYPTSWFRIQKKKKKKKKKVGNYVNVML